MNTTRRLVLVRHGHAELGAPSDHSRALSRSGMAAAGQLGQWLRDGAVVPDAALHSSALRTTGTWQGLRDAAGFTCSAEASDAVYTAEPDSLLDILRTTAPEVGTLLVVGHNPTISFLAQWLDGGEGDAAAGEQMLLGFNPAACAVLGVPGEWADLAPGACDVLAFRPGP